MVSSVKGLHQSSSILRSRASDEARRLIWVLSPTRDPQEPTSALGSSDEEDGDGQGRERAGKNAEDEEDEVDWKVAMELLRERDRQRSERAHDALGTTDTAGSEQLESRGPCAACGYEVFTNQARERNPDGEGYVHVVCPPSPAPSPAAHAAEKTISRGLSDSVGDIASEARGLVEPPAMARSGGMEKRSSRPLSIGSSPVTMSALFSPPSADEDERDVSVESGSDADVSMRFMSELVKDDSQVRLRIVRFSIPLRRGSFPPLHEGWS